ncbi:DNA-binding response regulator [Tenacibaculum sp. SZ-18]|uniref:LytR/AlgR family response regulator transcription factor n=1 Tax=Tenacibaculum sp. SZ-18 TaxID=754423 RepID=UPI000C2D40C8|nr:LytTR family DNA-binding domain-containing protein [Tenacibaculum sp. SZ-18]AUC14088.1 DNA-binding response regulator [Tenacibaculum sp. SZ-18]
MNKTYKCVVVDDEPIAREIIESFIEKTPNLKLLGSFQNAVEVLSFEQKDNVDLYFLDINMPEINGLSLAKIINKKAHIIFTTAYRDYAIDGFNLNVVDYLLKPIAFDRFLQAIEKLPKESQLVNTTFNQEQKSDFLFIRSERKMIKVSFNDILYIESLSDYIKIYLSNEVIVTRETISNINDKLPQNLFIRIHRSYIISINKIHSYTNEFIEVSKKALPISRSYKESVLQKLAGM